MSTHARHQVLRRVSDRTANVVVVGQGYVGLSLASAAAEVGYDVVGVDVDPARVAALTDGRLVVPGVDEAQFALGLSSGRLRFTVDHAVVDSADVVVICVPTPVLDHRPDLQYVHAATEGVAPHLQPGALVILESTTYPGTTEEVVAPTLESFGHRIGSDVSLAYSPERIDPGNGKYGIRTTPRIVGGIDGLSTDTAASFYAQVVDDVRPLSGCRVAELAKLLENTFRSVNIALVNELAQVCSSQGIDVWEVIDAAASKPFGFMRFEPGPGVGGHCIPLDPEYLAWQSHRDTGRRFRLVELSQDINASMPEHVAVRIGDALNDRGVAVRGARVLALGVTYKPDVGDVRESASLHVLDRLRRRGADIAFHDPFVDVVEFGDGVSLQGHAADAAALARADCVALLTPHSSYDLDLLVRRARLVFDARHAIPDPPAHVISL